MEYIIDKFSHKFLFFCMDFFFASVFVFMTFPLGMKYLDMSFFDYYLLSTFILAAGGAFLDRGFIFMYQHVDEDYKALNIYHWTIIFANNILLYAILGFVIWFASGNAFLSFYIPIHLFFGGWTWFFCLTGYMNAREDAGEESKLILRIQKKSK